MRKLSHRAVKNRSKPTVLGGQSWTDRLYEQNLTYVATNSGAHLRIHYSDGNLDRIQNVFQSLENAVLADDGIDPVTGKHWTEMIDLDSWVKKYLLEEISGNLDAGAISQYFYADDSGKIFAGPVWDYDMTLGNKLTWQIDTANMLYAGRPHLWNAEDVNWYYGLYNKPEFRSRLEQLYREVFRPLLVDMLDNGIRETAEQVCQAANLNAVRWRQGDPEAEIAQMEAYMRQRMAFLDDIWLNGQQYYTVELCMDEHVIACYAVVPGGTIPYHVVPYGNESIVYKAWRNGKDDSLFGFDAPITEDTFVYLETWYAGKEIMGMERGGLSALIKYAPAAAMGILLGAVVCADFVFRRKTKSGRKYAQENKV